MKHPRPLQPKAAWSNAEDISNVTGQRCQHHLVDLDQASLPYSRNHYMLVELMTTGGELPQKDCDIVIFHHKGIVLSIAQVSGVIAIQANASHPGQYRTLVSVEPMTGVAGVPVSEDHEDYLEKELDHNFCRIDENRCPRTSKGHMPKGAPMRDQAGAAAFVISVLVDAHCGF
jgi:hypothetical protein